MVVRSLFTCALLVFQLALLLTTSVKADGAADGYPSTSRIAMDTDTEDKVLLAAINSYRVTLNLTAFTDNQNAACLAEQIAEQFKDQPCTNTTGDATVPGLEVQIPNYPALLAHCHLNITITRDGQVMPACVPGLDPGLVTANFTKSQYTRYLNDSAYTGAGIASEDNWIVVVLTTNTTGGSFESTDEASSVSVAVHNHFLQVWLVFLLIMIF